MRIRTNDRRGSQSNETEQKNCCSVVLVIEHNWNGTFRWVRLVRLPISIELIELNRRDHFDLVGQKNKMSCTVIVSYLQPELDPLSSPFFLTTNFSPTPTAKEHSWQLLTITFTIVNFTELGFTLSALSDISPVYSCLIFRQPHNLFDLNALFQRWPCLADVRLLKCSNSKRSIVLDWQNFGVSSILFDYRSQSNDWLRLRTNAERLWNLVID